MVPISAADFGNQPQQLKEGIWAFPPNNLCNGAQSWWLGCDPEPVLIDCPPVTPATIECLKTFSLGRPALIVLTNRESHGRVSALHDALGWPVLVQEQEAYLLPGIKKLSSFSEECLTTSGLRLLWTPGPTPGSCVLYAPAPWNVLFCGRLLIPLKSNRLEAVLTKTTFHWTRQQKSLEKLRQWLPRDRSPVLASGVGVHSQQWRGAFDWKDWKSS